METGNLKKLSLRQNYAGRHVLLTGATGFVGKVLLSMLMQRLPEVECIYVLVRKNNSTVAERFAHQFSSSPVFLSVREQQDSEWIKKKIQVIEGDLTLSHLGIHPTVAQHLYEKIDLVIHLAGLVDFFPSIQLALNINVYGTLHVADFVSRCRCAALLHVSTCYVAGNRRDSIAEKIYENVAPNGEQFDVGQELAMLQDSIQQLTSLRENVELGKRCAARWGWTNTYTYTKALAELLLIKRYPQLRCTIVRPSIIESAVSYPFAGWNEGLNTCGPYCYIMGSWYPYLIAKKDQVLDIIPVDIVCKGILIIGAALLQDDHLPVYQLATSCANPLYLTDTVTYVRAWHRKNFHQIANHWTTKYLRCFKKIKIIAPDHFLSPTKLASVTHTLLKKSHKLQNYSIPMLARLMGKISHYLTILERQFRYLDKLQRTYRPFLYDYSYRFVSDAINQHNVLETEFEYGSHILNWSDYWCTIQMPGLSQWVFPLLEINKDAKSII